MCPEKRLIALLTLVVLVIALSGCASPSPTAAPTVTATPSPAASQAASATPAPAAQTASVTIKDFAFKPDLVHIAAGGSVTWTNGDTIAHTVKFGDSESPAMAGGASYTKKFDVPGTYIYQCGIHPSMTGTVEVA
jgi:plastocyanin